MEWLLAECAGPPERRVVDAQLPLDAVHALRERVLDARLREAGDRRPHRDRARLVAVEVGNERDDGPRGIGLAAEHAQAADPHRACALEPHRTPDAAGVPVGVDAVPVLEDAGDVALRGAIGLTGARDLDREEVLAAPRHVLGDVELVREEVALGVTEVRAVEPHVPEIEDAVEDEPAARARPVRRADPFG